VVLSTLWYTNLCGTEGAIKDTERPWVDSKVASLSDLTHSAGIACIASLFALVVAFCFAVCFSRISDQSGAIVRFVLALILGVTFILMFGETYRRVGRMAQSVIEQVLLCHVWKKATTSPLTVYVSPTCTGPRSLKRGPEDAPER